MIPFELVVFDLDGTLADTAPDLAAALNRMLADRGRQPLPLAQVRGMIGHGARALVRKALAATGPVDDVLVDATFGGFLEAYTEAVCIETRPFGGVEDALADLAHCGVRAAICTNKPEGLSRALVEALGWEERFAALVGGDTLAVKKPDPAPLLAAIGQAGGGRAIFVGDSITDADTARATGVPFVAVSFGYCDGPVSSLGADAVIDSFSELLPALTGLGSAYVRP